MHTPEDSAATSTPDDANVISCPALSQTFTLTGPATSPGAAKEFNPFFAWYNAIWLFPLYTVTALPSLAMNSAMFTVSWAFCHPEGFPRPSEPQLAVVSRGRYQNDPETLPLAGVKLVKSVEPALKALTRGGMSSFQPLWS